MNMRHPGSIVILKRSPRLSNLQWFVNDIYLSIQIRGSDFFGKHIQGRKFPCVPNLIHWEHDGSVSELVCNFRDQCSSEFSQSLSSQCSAMKEFLKTGCLCFRSVSATYFPEQAVDTILHHSFSLYPMILVARPFLDTNEATVFLFMSMYSLLRIPGYT